MKKIIIISTIFFLTASALAQNVGIGTTTPNASAQLDISSNTKGILIPRMTEAEKNAIISPVQGLMVFNTSTNSFQYYNSSVWINISNSGIISGAANKVAKFNGPWGLTPGMLTDNGTGVSLNTGSAIANSSALLDISSNSKGILIPRMTSVERTAIVSPATGLLVFDNTTTSFWFYNGSAWTEFNSGTTSSNWTVNGTAIYNNNSGSVGIGNAAPFYKLDVAGTIHGSSNAYLDGNVGIGTAFPIAKLDVNGSINATGNLDIDGNLTVNNGKGILRNSAGSAQLKYYTRQATFSAILGGFALSAEGSIGFNSSIFTNPPQVIVGDIVSTGGTVGELYRVQLVIYDVTTTGCKARLLNTSPNPVNYSITWNIVCIGD